jgi:hypothetical protein
MKTLLPGVFVGVMFLLAAAAASSNSDNRGLVLELADDSAAAQSSLAKELSVLRPHRPAKGMLVEAFPVEPADKVISDGVKLLSDDASLCALERVTVEVSLRESRQSGSAESLHRATAQLLSRQMDSLLLRVTLRVAPENVLLAVDLLEDMLAEGVDRTDHVAVSVDDAVPVDQLLLDVVRSQILVPQEGRE